MLPNAPYVFTRCSGSKLAFISWRDDSIFITGAMLSNTTAAATTYRAMWYAGAVLRSEGGRIGSQASHRSLMRGMHKTTVTQFSHDRLPETINAAWNRIVMMPAIDAIGCGAK